MSKFEETLKKTWEDVGKLEQQIEATLKSLVQDTILEEANLIPLLETKPIVSKASSSKLTGKRPALSSKKSKSNNESSQQPSKSTQNDDRLFALPMSTVPKKLETTVKLSSKTFSCSETDLFLVPVLDKWIFGATFVNSSSVAQKLPYVLLNLVNGKGNILADSADCVLTYTFKSVLINVEDNFNFMNNLNILPVQEALLGVGAGDIKDEYKVKPGAKFLVTVCFSHPVLTVHNEVSMIISLCSDRKQLWTKSMEISSRLALSYNEEIVAKFSVEIFTALGQHTESFQLENLGSPNNNTTLETSLIDFIVNVLGLSKNRTVQTRFDMKTDIYCTSKMTFLWGCLIQIEICSRNAKSIQCSVSARTPEQLRLINTLLSGWIMEQQQKENSKIHTTSFLLKNSNELISEAFHEELKTLIHFLYLDHRKMFQGEWSEDMEVEEVDTHGQSLGSSDIFSKQSKTRVTVKWLRNYIQNMNSTDVLMNMTN